MLGALAGDIIGSIYELHPIKTKEFPLFDWRSRYTDDSVLTVAVADTLLNDAGAQRDYAARFHAYYWRYREAGYGRQFQSWARSPEPRLPYQSFGNGAAMRVSPVAWAFEDLDAVLAEARCTAEVTHNHHEGIKGAQATAAATFLARRHRPRNEIRAYIEETFGYDLRGSIDALRPSYRYDGSCQGTVPPAILSFLEADDFEDAICNAVSLA